MADTRQIVQWSLERPCRYRHGDRWTDPEVTAEQLADFGVYASAMSEGEVVNGVCVWGWSSVCPFKTPQGKTDWAASVDIPCLGFVVAERFAERGGIETALATCANCEANAWDEPAGRLAGCFGHLSVAPQSEGLDECLRSSLRELGITTEFFRHFRSTTPIWYGLWSESPLRSERARVLRPVLEHAFVDEDRKQSGVAHFLKALELCERSRTPLHVTLAPPGHSDLGWYTEFPHCPRCKAAAPVASWQATSPTKPMACQVCGETFRPTDTHKQVRESSGELERGVLEKQLGPEEYGRFVRASIEAQGYTAEQAIIAWNEHQRSREVGRKAAAAREERWKSEAEVAEHNRKEEALRRLQTELRKPKPCPTCGKPLRTALAKQCFECGADWH